MKSEELKFTGGYNGQVTENTSKISKNGPMAVTFYNYCPFNNRGIYSIKNKTIKNVFLQNCSFKIQGNDNEIYIGQYSRLHNCRFYISGNHCRIRIGDNRTLIDSELYIEDNGGEITTGYETGICGSTQLTSTEGCRISIGKECMFSSEIHVRTGDSHSILNEEGNRINHASDVEIGDHVWVGNRAILLKGTAIGNGGIVASAAVVTHRFPEKKCVVAGNPARVIKQNVSWLGERIETKE